MHLFDENMKVEYGLTPAGYRTAAEADGAAVDMAKYSNFACVIGQVGATQWQGAVTYQIAEGTTSTQFSDTFLATATIASATTDQEEVLEINAAQMSDGYRYLRVEATPAAGTGNLIAVLNCRFNPRYAAVSN